MTRIAAALTFIPSVLAVSLLNLTPGTREVDVVLQVNKVTSQAAIDVWNEDGTEVWAQSCSRELRSGPFENMALVFDVDNNGSGTLSVGSKKYTIADSELVSGGIKCGRVVNGNELVVTCHVPISNAVQLRRMAKRDLQDCFPKGPVKLTSVVATFERNSTDVDWGNVASDKPPELAQRQDIPPGKGRRQYACSQWSPVTHLVGDGNPHQNPLHIQVTIPMNCTAPTCSISYQSVKSFSISWSATLNPFTWISGGFAVEKQVQTGTQATCEGGKGDYFAVWKAVGQTAYTVQNFYFNSCTGYRADGKPFVMWSPNANDAESQFYCVFGKDFVRRLGDRWTDYNGRAGGP